MDEEWKDIEGYEGLYAISNLGRIKSYERWCGFYLKSESIRNSFYKSNGYECIDLYNRNHKKQKYYVHRLVAKAFIGNPENKPEVNHKDCNPQNNKVDNLEWVTSVENKKAGDTPLHMSQAQKSKKSCKPVEQYTLDGVFIKGYISAADAARETGIDSSTISKVCRHVPKYNTCGGYVWKYKDNTVSSLRSDS